MTPYSILVVDDEEGIRFGISSFLTSQGFQVTDVGSCAAVEQHLPLKRFDAIVCDYSLGDGTALELLPKFKEHNPTAPVIVLTAHGTIDLAVQCVKAGADQFLTKPVGLPVLEALVNRGLEARRAYRASLAASLPGSESTLSPFLGDSPAIRQLESEANKSLATQAPRLVIGETGTGKGVLVKWLHGAGRRAGQPFVNLNCAGLNRDFLDTQLFGHDRGAFTGAVTAKPGLLEYAHLGTLFLDEIGDMDLQVQGKLLKVLEEKSFRRVGEVKERHVDVRLVAATNRDLEQRVREGTFREDLLYRINAITLHVPPLRERRADIPVLAATLLKSIAAEMGRPHMTLDDGALTALQASPWPGNIRQLRNTLERAAIAVAGETLTAAHLQIPSSSPTPSPSAAAGPTPAPSDAPASLGTLEAMEVAHLERVLRSTGFKVEPAAKILGISKSTLYAKMRQHALAAPGKES